MADDIAIRVNDVSKDFILPHQKRTTLKEYLIHPFQRVDKEVQHALEGVSLEIKKGDFFGIVGRNGSGKSTLLKTIAGVYSPTNGSVTVNGKLVPFIELGVGFNPDLTARDNVYLNSALLGFSREETTEMYAEIVEFAELENHMDQKLKNFSSGMQVRLAFSIAIRAESDILLLDEVLAVGDEAFQKKCNNFFDKIKKTGKTVILVTHDMSSVKKYCNRASLLRDGELVKVGSPEEVSALYFQLNSESTDKDTKKENLKEKQTHTHLKLETGVRYSHKDEAVLTVNWNKVEKRVKNIGVALFRNNGDYVFGANTILDDVEIEADRYKELQYKLDLDIGTGDYHFKVGLFGETDREVVEFIDRGPKFTVDAKSQKWEGITHLQHSWRVPKDNE